MSATTIAPPLPLAAEIARQVRRRRTIGIFIVLAVLPLVLLLAFWLGNDSSETGERGFVDLAQESGANLVIFTLFASTSFLLIVIVALFAVLQAATLLIYDFKTGNTNIGFNILSITLFVLWFRICFASSKGRPFDPDSFLTAEGFGPSGRSSATTASVSPKASMISRPVSVSARGHSNAGAVAFGKRGRS